MKRYQAMDVAIFLLQLLCLYPDVKKTWACKCASNLSTYVPILLNFSDVLIVLLK